jgi:hypothetical protein
VCWALVCGFAGSTLLLILLLGFDYDTFHRATFRAYPLVSYAVFALWIGAGMQWAGGALAPVIRPALPARALLGALLVGTVGISHWPANDRSRDAWAELYGRVILESLPANARFFGNADTVDGPVGYLHHVEGVRPDVQVANGHSLSLRGKLYRPYALTADGLDRLIRDFIATAPGPVLYSNDFPQPYGADFYGLYFSVNRDGDPGMQRTALIRGVAVYFRMLDGIAPPADPWENMHYRLLRLDQCRLEWSLRGAPLSASAADLPAACNGFHGRLWLAEQFLGADRTRVDLRAVRRLLEDARSLRDEAIHGEEIEQLEALWHAVFKR